MQRIQMCVRKLARAIILGNERWASFEELAQACNGMFANELAALKNALLNTGKHATKEAGEILKFMMEKLLEHTENFEQGKMEHERKAK